MQEADISRLLYRHRKRELAEMLARAISWLAGDRPSKKKPVRRYEPRPTRNAAHAWKDRRPN